MQAEPYALLEQIHGKSEKMATAHHNRVRTLTCRANTMKAVIAVLTFALSAESTSALTSTTMPAWVYTLFNVLMIVLAAIQTFFAKLDFANKIAAHKQTYTSFNALAADITLYLVRDPNERNRTITEEIDFAVARYNALEEAAPELSTSPCFDEVRPSPIQIKLGTTGSAPVLGV